MTAADNLISIYQTRIGSEIHCGPWLEINQQRINAFSTATGDVQWIHIDPERARLESPYATTIAHGFLTLSLLPLLTESNAPGFFEENYPGMRLRINYGLNKVRFPEPVRVGSRIRARMSLTQLVKINDAVQFTYLVTVEINGLEKPACVAESVVRVYP